RKNGNVPSFVPRARSQVPFPARPVPSRITGASRSYGMEHNSMSAHRQPERDPPGPESEQVGEWVQVPSVIDANGDKVITLYNGQGQPRTRLVGELIMESFVGPRPPGHVLRFKDGNRLNCELSNLEWVAARVTRSEAARARAIATRERADALRRRLEGRPHSD